MKRCGIRKNNRGDSLILVIGCIALLSIVGVVLLVKTMDNRSMKLAEEQAQASFAGAESGSAEMVTVIEAAALDVIEMAFGDMMLEYSLLADNDARDDRYKQFFEEKLDNVLSTGTFQEQLTAALGGAGITDLKVERGAVVVEAATESGYTNTVRIQDVKFTYKANGSETKITTDICVNAVMPNVTAGFNSGISCDFLDFALVSDGNVSIVDKPENMLIDGNMYIGGDFRVTGGSAVAKINNARKMLVKNEIKLTNGGQIWVKKADDITFSKGEGVWAGGISVSSSTLNTNGVNVYVKDDLAINGTSPNVKMEGGSSEYVGYSGGTGLVNHERSSAININESSNLMLDLSGLGELYINGNSYICEDNSKWGSWDGGTIVSAEGILQGESIAYKDMQALYLFPGACLPNHKHNPIIGSLDDNAIGTPNLLYQFKRDGSDITYEIDLANYVDLEDPYVTRTAILDGGATVATYVYLNFKNEASAAQYVEEYLSTFLGDSVKAQIKNLGSSSRISLPTKTFTLSNAISYDGTSLTMIPAANATKKNLLDIAGLLAEQRAQGLFSSLRAEGGVPTTPGYRMVRDGILNMNAFTALAPNEKKEIEVTASTGEKYVFCVYNGNLEITNNSEYSNKHILVVNGNLKITATPVTINGLVLVTGDITQAAGADFTAKKEAVETLLANEEVAKYFRVYGADSGHGYLSTEAVKISFKKWKKN